MGPPTDSKGQIIQVRDFSERMGAALLSRRDKLSKLVPTGFNTERLVRTVVLSIQQNPMLAKCTPESLLSGALDAARLGLEVGGQLGQAYLVPFRNARKGVHESTFIFGYKGMINVARRSDRVGAITAKNVFEGDIFRVWDNDSGEHLTHECVHGGTPRDWPHLTASYATARIRVGDTFDVQRAVVWRDELEKIKKRGEAKNGPWRNPDDIPAMCAKTAIRRLSKYLPMDAEVMRALDREELLDTAHEEQIELDISPQVIEIVDPSTGELSAAEEARMERELTGGDA